MKLPLVPSGMGFALEMTGMGEVAGTLHTVFDRLGDAFEDDLEFQG